MAGRERMYAMVREALRRIACDYRLGRNVDVAGRDVSECFRLVGALGARWPRAGGVAGGVWEWREVMILTPADGREVVGDYLCAIVKAHEVSGDDRWLQDRLREGVKLIEEVEKWARKKDRRVMRLWLCRRSSLAIANMSSVTTDAGSRGAASAT